MEGVGAQLKEEKEMALNESMEKLAVGIGEAKVGDNMTISVIKESTTTLLAVEQYSPCCCTP